MFNYAKTAVQARNSLQRFGGQVPGATFTRETGGGGQPGQNSAPSIQSWQAIALVFDYSGQSQGDGTRLDALIQAGDKQLYAAAIDAAGAPITAPAKPDKCLAPDGVEYTVETVKPLGPAGVLVLYEIQLRR